MNASRYTNTGDVDAAIVGMKYLNDKTNTSGGLRVAKEGIFSSTSRGNRASVQDVAIVITDGISTVDKNRTVR